MKKINKIIVMILMVALSIGSIFISPVTAVMASAATVGAAITLSKVPTKGVITEGVEIPLGSTVSGSTVTVVIKDPNGTEIYRTGDELPNGWTVNEGKLKFLPTMLGDYKVQYLSSATTGYFGVASDVYTITVTGIKPVLTFAENTKDIIPDTIGYKDSNNAVYKITLPTPVATDYNVSENEKEEIELGKVSAADLTVEQITKLEAGELTTAEIAGLVGYTVTATDSKHTAVALSYTYSKSSDDVYTIKYTVSPVENTYGTYTLLYTYASGTTGLKTSKRFTFEVKKNFEAETELSFNWADGETMPTTAYLGEEVKLPEPVVANENGRTVASYTEVEVYHVEANKSGNFEGKTYQDVVAGNVEGWTAMDVENYSFVASKKAVDGAHYLVKYLMKDFFGNELTKQYTITNVYDSQKPVVYMVADYSADGVEADIETSVQTMLPTKVKTGKSILLPAIYATDNSDNSVEEDAKGLTLSRTYRYDNSISYNFNTSSLITSAHGQTAIADDEEVYFTPNASGTYTFYYEATDKAGKVSNSVKFTIEVEDNYEDTIAPIINLPTVDGSAYTNQTITFEAPTAVDYSDADKTTIVDKNIKTSVGYYYVYNDSKPNSEVQPLSLNENGEYSLTIANDSTIEKAVLVFTAEDHAGYTGDTNNNNVATEEVEILVKDVSSDTEAPVLASSLVTGTFGQSGEKTINDVVFQDDNNVSVSIRVTAPEYVDGTGYDYTDISNAVAVSGKTITKSGNNYTVSGAKFTSYHVGEHVVTLVAKDANDNTTIVSYVVNVERTEKPYIDVVAAVPTTAEVGKEIVLPTGVVRDQDGTAIDADVAIEFEGANPDYELTGNRFIAKEDGGVYTFVYTATVKVNGVYTKITSSPKTISASDTLAPTITLVDESWENASNTSKYNHTEALSFKEDSAGTFMYEDGKYVTYDASKDSVQNPITRYSYADIEIPGFTVSDRHFDEETQTVVGNNTIVEWSVKVTTKDSDNKEKTLLESINGKDLKVSGSSVGYDSYYTFTPIGNGLYTVEYSATDIAGKTTTKSYSLQVGDCEDPVIALNNAQNIASTAKIGDVLEIDLNVIELSDNVDQDIVVSDAIKANSDVKFTIEIITPSKTTVKLSTDNDDYYSSEDKKFTYELSEAGDYTVKYVLTDSAGREDEITKKIKVSGVNSSSILSEQAVGTILIVASVALLAGVVVYFVVTNKKYTSKKKETK